MIIDANGFYSAAEDILAKLADYGITSAVMDEFRSLIDAYEVSLSGKEASMSVQTSSTKNVEDLFRQLDDLLEKKIDPLMLVLSKQESEFYAEYQQARVVKDMGAARTAKQTPAAKSTAASTPEKK